MWPQAIDAKGSVLRFAHLPSVIGRSKMGEMNDGASGSQRRPSRAWWLWDALAVAAVVLGALVALRMPDLFGRGPTDVPEASVSATSRATGGATAGASPTGEVATPTDLIGPGPAQPGELLLRFTQPCDVVPPILTPKLTFLHDGRVVWHHQDPAGDARTRRALATVSSNRSCCSKASGSRDSICCK
jgi:hypothetical protein